MHYLLGWELRWAAPEQVLGCAWEGGCAATALHRMKPDLMIPEGIHPTKTGEDSKREELGSSEHWVQCMVRVGLSASWYQHLHPSTSVPIQPRHRQHPPPAGGGKQLPN